MYSDDWVTSLMTSRRTVSLKIRHPYPGVGSGPGSRMCARPTPERHEYAVVHTAVRFGGNSVIMTMAVEGILEGCWG